MANAGRICGGPGRAMANANTALRKKLAMVMATTPASITDKASEATKLTVYFGSQNRVYGVPAYEVICELLHCGEIEVATALLGVDGTAHRASRPGISLPAGAPVSAGLSSLT